MKKILKVLAVLVVVFTATILFAEEKKEEKAWEFELKPEMGTKYVSDFGLTYLDESFVGATATLSNKNGGYGAVSSMYSPSRRFDSGETTADWVEAFGGKTGTIGSWVRYDAYAGVWTYELDNLKHPNNGAYAMSHAKFPRAKVLGMTPFVGGGYYYVFQNTSQNGFVWRGGVEFELKGVKLKAFATGHDNVFGSDSAVLASGIVAASYSISLAKNIALVPSVLYQYRFEDRKRDGGLTQEGLAGRLALVWTF